MWFVIMLAKHIHPFGSGIPGELPDLLPYFKLADICPTQKHRTKIINNCSGNFIDVTYKR